MAPTEVRRVFLIIDMLFSLALRFPVTGKRQVPCRYGRRPGDGTT
jgi:hypothetical protein